jgi:uncharacterized protein
LNQGNHLDFEIWILTGLVVFIACLTMSIAGFGFGLVATPLLFLFLDSKLVVLFSAGLGSVIGLLILIHARQYIKPKIIAILGLSSLIGIPVGIYLISNVSAPILKIVIGVLVIFFAVLIGLGYSIKTKNEYLGCAMSGFIGGALMSGTGLGGPPVVFFLLNQEQEKNIFRACLSSFLLTCGIASFATLGISGIVSGTNLLITITFIPLVIIAYLIGIAILPHINQILFRKIVLAVTLLSGTAGIITAIVSLVK